MSDPASDYEKLKNLRAFRTHLMTGRPVTEEDGVSPEIAARMNAALEYARSQGSGTMAESLAKGLAKKGYNTRTDTEHSGDTVTNITGVNRVFPKGRESVSTKDAQSPAADVHKYEDSK